MGGAGGTSADFGRSSRLLLHTSHFPVRQSLEAFGRNIVKTAFQENVCSTRREQSLLSGWNVTVSTLTGPLVRRKYDGSSRIEAVWSPVSQHTPWLCNQNLGKPCTPPCAWMYPTTSNLAKCLNYILESLRLITIILDYA